MKIAEYGIVFQPMFHPDEQPFAKLEQCAKFIMDKRTDATPSYQLSIKVIWNNKTLGWLQLKYVHNIVYVHMVKSRFVERGGDSNFIERLLKMMPPMQDHGIVSVGVLNI
jgi:hypothetical protein